MKCSIEAKKKILELKAIMSETQGVKKPLFDFSRFTMWNGEPCFFCGSKEGIHEVMGRYIFASMNDEGDYIPRTQIYFCGICEDEMEKHFDMLME